MNSKIYNLLILILLLGCNERETNHSFNVNRVNDIHSTFCVTFSPDLNEVYFTKAEGVWGKEKLRSSIYYSKIEDGNWLKPQKVKFAHEANNSSPHLTRDGRRLYYISNQAIANDSSSNIWYVERHSIYDPWSVPKPLDFTINSPYAEYSPKTTANGDLYFASSRSGGLGQGDLYMSKLENGRFKKPMNLGQEVNSDKGEWNLELSEDGNILIFEASQRPENKTSYGDLYISFKTSGSWSKPKNIIEINTTGSDLYPTIVDDLLYYSSSDSLSGPRTNLKVTSLANIIKKYKN